MDKARVMGATAVLLVTACAAWAGPTTVTIGVKEDVSVRSSAPNTNYASSLPLYAGTATTTVYRSYLKFDLSTLPDGAEVSDAILTVWSRRVGAAGTGVWVFAAGDGWSETTLTWANAPAPPGEALDRSVLTAGSSPVSHAWDVTAAAAAEAQGDRTLTLVLAESTPPAGTWAWFTDRLDGVAPGASLCLELKAAAPKDVTPPTVALDLLQTKLWPPNHEMVRCATLAVADDLDPSPTTAVEVANSEASVSSGSGQTDPDVEIKSVGEGKWEVWLRAERSGGGKGRQYSLRVTARDAAGNETAQDGVVAVPHDQGNGKSKAP